MALRGLPGCLFGSKSNDCCSPIVVPHGMAHAGLSFGKVRDGAGGCQSHQCCRTCIVSNANECHRLYLLFRYLCTLNVAAAVAMLASPGFSSHASGVVYLSCTFLPVRLPSSRVRVHRKWFLAVPRGMGEGTQNAKVRCKHACRLRKRHERQTSTPFSLVAF